MDPKLLEILVCPVTKGPLTWDREKQELVSRSALVIALYGLQMLPVNYAGLLLIVIGIGFMVAEAFVP